MEETSAGHLVVQRDLTIQGMSINESVNITGNVIEPNVTNADLELRAYWYRKSYISKKIYKWIMMLL